MLNIDKKVQRKIILHSLKHPTSNIYGFLLGTITNDIIKITDIIPMTHNPINSCFLHMSLDLVSKTPQKIIGIYDAIENLKEEVESFQLEKMLLKTVQKFSKINESFYIKMVLKNNKEKFVDYEGLSYKEGLSEFHKEDFIVDFEFYKMKDSFKLFGKEGVKSDFDESVVERDFMEGKHLGIVDLDDHLDDPSLDFFNTQI